MNKLTLRAALVGSLLAVAAIGMTQGGGGGGGQGFNFGAMGQMQQSKSAMLRRSDVQKDLKLSEDQIAKLNELQRAAIGNFMGGGNMDAEAIKKAVAEGDKAALALLTADQQKRLKEIGYSIAKNGALKQPEVQAELGLTDAQKAKVKTLTDQQTKAYEDVRKGANNDFRAVMDGNRKVDEVMDVELGKVLTAEQKTKFEAMKGKPFVADPNGGGFGGFGGGNRGGGGGNGGGGNNRGGG